MDGQRHPNKNIANLMFIKKANTDKVEKTYNFFVNFFNKYKDS